MVLVLSLILLVLVGGMVLAQDADATPISTPEATPTLEATPTSEATPEVMPDLGGDEGAGEGTDRGDEDEDGEDKVKVCHIPGGDKDKANTIEISRDALESHLDHGDYEGECEEEFEGDADEELGGAGSKPGDFFYGVDKFFDDWLGNCLDNRQERVAELKALIKEKRFDDAEEALKGYEECAKEVEKEVGPGERGEAERSAKAIRKAIRGIEREVPDEHKKKFVSDVIDKEEKIEAAAEIAAKIKDLCEQLAKLDPNEYSRVCSVKEDAPQWQRELDEDLTEDQRKAARKFANVMKQCFSSQGRKCECNELEEINKPFADRCSIVAPLAAKCESGGESSCEAMDEAMEGIEDLLPEYLQDVFNELDGGVKEDQFEFHMPSECREAGVKTPKECMKVMFEANAPEECQQALKEGKISFENEREAREACEDIMFRENAPEECVEAGLKNPKECGQFMFKQNAPQECIDAGLTGEKKDDPRKCEKLMKEQFGEGPEGPGGRRGPGPGPDCRRIENSEERLKCYDGALEGVRSDGEGGFGREGGDHGGWPPPCQEAQAFTRDSCEKIMREWGEKQRSQDEERFKGERENRDQSFRDEYENKYRDFRPPEDFREGDHPPEGGFRQPPEGFKEGEGFRPPEDFRPPEGQQPPEGFQQSPTGEGSEPSNGQTAPSGDSGSSGGTSSGGDSGSASGGDSGSGGGESGSSGSGGGDSGVTGAMITGNAFFDYYYWG